MLYLGSVPLKEMFTCVLIMVFLIAKKHAHCRIGENLREQHQNPLYAYHPDTLWLRAFMTLVPINSNPVTILL